MIVILDGNSIAYRAYHKAPPLTASDGTPTGTVHIFFTILERVKNQLSPDEIIAVFDARGKTTRHEMYPEYKANREAMPEDLAPQIDMIKELLPIAGIKLYCKAGIEADDIIATLAKKSNQPVTIVTKDKDLYQLVNDRVKIYDDMTGSLLGIDATIEKYGVAPDQMLSYLSLLGDKSDNIPGVNGVGAKTAAKLVQEFGSLDGIYANIDSQKGKLKENLLRDKECAYTAMTLIALQDVSVEEPEDKTNKVLLREKLSELGMRMIANKLLSDSVEKEEEVVIPQLPPCMMAEVTNPIIFIAVEDGLYVSDGTHYESFNPERHKTSDTSIYYDVKEFMKYTQINSTDVKDYLLISWLCEPDLGAIKKSKTEPMEEFIPRLIFMTKSLDEKLIKLKLVTLYKDVELKSAYILSHMEKTGIKVDPARVREIANVLKRNISVVATKLMIKAGYELNLNSPKQMAEFLYDKLGISQLSKNKRSTAEDVLVELAVNSPEHKDTIDEILQYRELSKLLSTYTQPLIDAIGKDGRIHTTFKQTGTGTGRLSSVAPNLQNIPARGEIGKTIRSAFIPESGYTFISLDYSQIELRILAHLSGDIELKKAFMEDKDIHTLTAMKIFNTDENTVDADLRRLAKAVNFGILYGLSPFGLSRDTGVTPKEAKAFIDAYFKLYSNVKNYISDTITFTRNNGFCETLLGRKRFFPDINSRNGLNRQRAERAAMNAPIQGSAADIIKVAMINCDKFISSSGLDVKLCLQIHDELIFEVKQEQADRVFKELKSIMENAVKLNVPLSVNGGIGSNWGDL